MQRMSASQVKDLSKVGATKISINVRKEMKVIQYSVLKLNTKDTKAKGLFLKSLVIFVSSPALPSTCVWGTPALAGGARGCASGASVAFRKSKARVILSIERDAIGQAGMIQ